MPIDYAHNQLCTFAAHGKKRISQKWYQCKTCGLVGNCGCCEVCSKKCHQGHEVKYQRISSHCFCDCPGHGKTSCQCQTIEKPV